MIIVLTVKKSIRVNLLDMTQLNNYYGWANQFAVIHLQCGFHCLSWVTHSMVVTLELCYSLYPFLLAYQDTNWYQRPQLINYLFWANWQSDYFVYAYQNWMQGQASFFCWNKKKNGKRHRWLFPIAASQVSTFNSVCGHCGNPAYVLISFLSV